MIHVLSQNILTMLTKMRHQLGSITFFKILMILFCLQTNEDVRLLTWCRTEQYVAMYFNDGTLQVNFTADHVKICVNSLHSRTAMTFTVADQVNT